MEGWREGEADHIAKLKEEERAAVKTSSCSFALVPLPLFVSPASQITILYMAAVEKNPGCSAPRLLLERWMRGRQGQTGGGRGRRPVKARMLKKRKTSGSRAVGRVLDFTPRVQMLG